MPKLKCISLLLATLLLLPTLLACRSDETKETDRTEETTTDQFNKTEDTTNKVTAEYETPDTQISNSRDGTTQVIYELSIQNSGYFSGRTTQSVTQDRGTTYVTVTPEVGYEFIRWSDGVTSPTRSGDKGNAGKITTLYAIMAPVYLEMPVLNLTTETGKDVTSKTEYIGGTLSVTNCNAEYALRNVPIEIRGRGNNSWLYEKKSYRIKLESKENLLGIGEESNKSWNLIANHCDQSLLRNYTALNFAGMMSGIAFSPACINVEVYINGIYNGVYLLCEAIQVNDGRVDINEDVESGTDIGYLLQMTHYAEAPYIYLKRQTYEIKNDLSQNEILAQEQSVYIENYLYQCYSAVERGDQAEIEKLIDLDSVVDTYIVEETVKNMDVGWDSFYLYKDAGGKLHLGPIWDFDLSLGNGNEGCEYYTDLYAAQNLKPQSNPWFYTLMSYDWFRTMVADRWASREVQDILSSLPEMIRKTAIDGYSSFCRNFEEWEIFGTRLNREPHFITQLMTYAQHYTYLIDWLTSRIDWMNGFIGSDRYNEGYNTDKNDDIVEPPSPPPSHDFTCSGGTGSLADPYLISTADDFASFTQAMQSGQTFKGQYLLQTADLDMTAVDNYGGIGSSGMFAGVYDGNGYVINAVLEGHDECIFPYVSGLVMNVGTTGSVFNSNQAAGICRSIRQGGGLINCYSLMQITSYVSGEAGGLSGSTQHGDDVFLVNCYFGGTVEGIFHSPSNVWVDGRGGNFGFLYSPDDLGAANLSHADILLPRDEMNIQLADLLNRHRTEAHRAADAYDLAEDALCGWSTGEVFPTLQHK